MNKTTVVTQYYKNNVYYYNSHLRNILKNIKFCERTRKRCVCARTGQGYRLDDTTPLTTPFRADVTIIIRFRFFFLQS